MTTYSLSSHAMARVRRRSVQLIGTIGLAVLAFMAGRILLRGQGDWVAFAISALVVIGLMALGGMFGFRLQRQSLESLRIELGEDYIARRQVRLGEVRLRRDEVRALRETAAGLQVLSADKYRSILVPRALDANDYQAVKARLMGWGPLEPARSPGRAWEWALAAVVALGVFVVYFSESPWLVLGAGLAVLAYYLFVGRAQLHAGGIDPAVRRLYTLGMILMLLSAALRVWLLFG